MLYQGNTPEGQNIRIFYWPIEGIRKMLRFVKAANTDEQWLEIFVQIRDGEGNARCMTSEGKLITAKIYINYDVVDSVTGAVLHEVRQ